MTALAGRHNALFHRANFPAFIVIAVFGVINLSIVLINHAYFRTVTLDYAVYNFAFFDYAHFRMSPCPMYIFDKPATFLQDHFSFTLMFLSPLYWIMTPVTGTYSLLIIQWVFIMWGGIATYRLILYKTNGGLLPLFSVVFYFTLFGRYSAYRGDVNLAIIGSAMIPVFIDYFERRKFAPAMICLVFLLLNREDYSLWLAFICLTLCIIHRKERKPFRLSAILGITSLVFFLLVIKVFIPAIEDENKKYILFNFAIVGETPGEALKFILTHPFDAIRFLFVNHNEHDYYNNVKAQFYWLYLISGGFILLLRPWYFIAFIPILAKKMYDDNPVRWSIETYYSIEFVSLIPVVVFMIIADLKTRQLKPALGMIVCAAAISAALYRFFMPVPNPVVGEANKTNFMHAAFYRPETDPAAVRHMLGQIPSEAAVCASGRILPHIAFRKKSYYFPRINDAEYICVFRENDTWPLTPEEFKTELNALRNSGDWQPLVENSDLLLLKKQ